MSPDSPCLLRYMHMWWPSLTRHVCLSLCFSLLCFYQFCFLGWAVAFSDVIIPTSPTLAPKKFPPDSACTTPAALSWLLFTVRVGSLCGDGEGSPCHLNVIHTRGKIVSWGLYFLCSLLVPSSTWKEKRFFWAKLGKKEIVLLFLSWFMLSFIYLDNSKLTILWVKVDKPPQGLAGRSKLDNVAWMEQIFLQSNTDQGDFKQFLLGPL